MKHDDIKHQVDIEGITYINLTENHIKDVIDFYFDVFLQGNMLIPDMVLSTTFWIN